MKEGILESCRQFYASCVSKGTIPVTKWNGKWYHSAEPEDFDNYLAKFNADDRKEILRAASPPTDYSSPRVKTISQNLPQSQVNSLLEKLREEDPREFDRLMRDFRCTTSQTTP